MFKKNDLDRRRFLKNASLASAGIALPALADKHGIMEGGAADPRIEIHTGNKVTVLVSVFTVQPENEQKLIQLFEEGTLSIFSRQPGYISASLHTGSDGKRLVLYGQWEGPEYIDAFRTKPEVGEYFQKIRQLATVESVVCNDVPFVHHK
jgi:quinol monooxygenase YgiN